MMKLPVIRGLIDRRILVNYRVDPPILQRLLPAPLRPKCVNGAGVAGICLIRLKRVRPRGWPGAIGLGSENAAHRIAVEWDDERGVTRSGVYIPRRDSSSRLNELVGGRILARLGGSGLCAADASRRTRVARAARAELVRGLHRVAA